ncbi:MAG: hypothetical protein RLZZ15_1294, partial [Verrucomicrobiota bacterium]
FRTLVKTSAGRDARRYALARDTDLFAALRVPAYSNHASNFTASSGVSTPMVGSCVTSQAIS